jgi:hypothetical protein
MTPKEKAFHLHFSFIRDVIADKEKAKKCALIAVDEMLNNGNLEPQLKQAKYRGKEPYTFELEYWFMVKKEIEQL